MMARYLVMTRPGQVVQMSSVILSDDNKLFVHLLTQLYKLSCYIARNAQCRRIYYVTFICSNAPIMFYVGLLSAALRSNAPIMFYVGLFFFFFFFFFLFTVRSQKLLDRFTQNFQELCILV